MNIIHGDIKSHNMLLEKASDISSVLLIDFGTVIEPGEEPTDFNIQSRWFRSPEIVFKTSITNKIDMWSAGCVLYFIWTKKYLI